MNIETMKSNKIITRLFLVSWLCCGVAAVLTSCKHVDEEPEVNSGYDTEIPLPKAEPMTAEDSAVVAAQKAEYELNAK